VTLTPEDTDRLLTALETIASALDSLAALHAAGPALKATGVPPTVDLTGLMVTGAPAQPEGVTLTGGPAETFVAPAQPDADGWIEWRGGERPVDPDVIVDVKYRAQPKIDGINGGQPAPADRFWWAHHGGRASEIVAYKVIE
jgi:hypothetical protein